MDTLTLQSNDLEDIIYGAALLGSGGGGPVAMALKLVDAFQKPQYPIRVLPLSSLADDALVAMVAGMGAPSQASRITQPFSNAPRTAVSMLQKRLNAPLAGILPIEVGPMNSVIPLLVSSQLGLPVVDGDGGGRAYSTLSMATFNLQTETTPYILCNDASPYGEDFVGTSLEVAHTDMADAISRGIIEQPAFQGAGACASFAMSGGQAKKCTVPDGLQRALALGQLLRPYRQDKRDALGAVMGFLGQQGKHLFSGTLDSVSQNTVGALDLGMLQLRDGRDGFTVFNLNENLIAWRDQGASPSAIAPDSICFLAEDGQTFTNASVAEYIGKRIHVIGIAASPLTRTPKILAAYQAGLLKLGYPGPCTPLDGSAIPSMPAAAPPQATLWRNHLVKVSGRG